MYDDLVPSGDLLDRAARSDDAGAIRFRRVRDLGDVVNVTFRFLRDNGRELGHGLLLVIGPAALAAALVNAWAQFSMQGAFTFDPSDPMAAYRVSDFVGPLIVSALASGAVQLLFQSSVLAYIERYRRGEAGTITAAGLWETTKETFFPVLTTTLIVAGLAFFAMVFLLFIPIVGFLAIIAGAIYLAPIVNVLIPQRVFEGDGFWEGFEATRHYMKGYWAQTSGLLVVVVLIVLGLVLALSIPGAIVQGAAGFNALDGGAALSPLAIGVSALFGLLVYVVLVVPVTAFAFQYFNLVERKEGVGLLADVDTLAVRLPEDEPPAADAAASGPTPSHPDAARPDAPDSGGFRGGGFDEGEDTWRR